MIVLHYIETVESWINKYSQIFGFGKPYAYDHPNRNTIQVQI